MRNRFVALVLGFLLLSSLTTTSYAASRNDDFRRQVPFLAKIIKAIKNLVQTNGAEPSVPKP